MRVSSVCSKDGACEAGGLESYKILHDISGSFQEFLSGASFTDFGSLPPRLAVRQKLYDVPRPYPNASPMCKKELQTLVETSAQSILRWLLKVPLFGTSFPIARDCSTWVSVLHREGRRRKWT